MGARTPGVSATDIAEIHQTLSWFAHAFDNNDADSIGRVFTDDAVVEGTVGRGYTIRGIDACAEFCRNRHPDTPDHNTSDIVVFVDDEGVVRARSRYFAPLIDGSVHAGDFFDVLTLTPVGWRISYRVSVPRNPTLEMTLPPKSFLDAWAPRAEQLRLTDSNG
jgi:hypothetical protein